MTSLSISDLRRAFFGDPEDEAEYLQAAYDNNLDIGAALALAGDRLTTGVEVTQRDRFSTTITPSSGTLRLTFFTSSKTLDVASLRTLTRGTAGASLTVAKQALFSVDENDDSTLMAATANSLAAFTANTRVTQALTASKRVVRGRRYAHAVLFVGTTPPNIIGTVVTAGSAFTAECGEPPRYAGTLAGQSDIPSSVTAASLTNSAQRHYGALIP